MKGRWPVQDAKQRLSELLRAAREDGPQVVTKHGEEVAVVLDVAEYRRLAGIDAEVDFKQALAGTVLSEEAAGGEASREVADVLRDVVERRWEQPRDLDVDDGR